MRCSAPTQENPLTWDRRVHLLTIVYRSTPHESTDFSPNLMVFGKKMYIPVDVMMGCPDTSSNLDELEHIPGSRDKLEDAYDADAMSKDADAVDRAVGSVEKI